MPDAETWRSRHFPEGPDKIAGFAKRHSAAESRSRAAIDALFNEVDRLAEAEIRFYFRRRRSRAVISSLFRILAWVFGSVGIVLPLVGAAGGNLVPSSAEWGYVSLALAASCLAANALFGGSSGHVRFVLTQLALERVIVRNRIEWFEMLGRLKDGENADEDFQAALGFIAKYADAIYETTISETGRWGDTLIEELKQFGQTVGKKPQ